MPSFARQLPLFALALSLLGACASQKPTSQPIIAREPASSGEVELTTTGPSSQVDDAPWEPPLSGSQLAQSELSATLHRAAQNGWLLIYLSPEQATMQKDKQLVVLRFEWQELVKDSSDVGFASTDLSKELGFAKHLARAKQEALDGKLSTYTLRKLAKVTVTQQPNRQLANVCLWGAERLSQFASAAEGPALYFFELYDDTDDSAPAGYNDGDLTWLLARAKQHIDLSPVRCESPTEQFVGKKAQQRLAQLLASHPLKEFSGDPQTERIHLAFQLALGETIAVELRSSDGGEVEEIKVITHNQGRHPRTYFKAQQPLAAWAAKGAVSSIRLEKGSLRLAGAGGTFRIGAEQLCCLAAEGENAGEEVCANASSYELELICGGRQEAVTF